MVVDRECRSSDAHPARRNARYAIAAERNFGDGSARQSRPPADDRLRPAARLHRSAWRHARLRDRQSVDPILATSTALIRSALTRIITEEDRIAGNNKRKNEK